MHPCPLPPYLEHICEMFHSYQCVTYFLHLTLKTLYHHLSKLWSFLFPSKKKCGPNIVKQRKLNSMEKWNRCNKEKKREDGVGGGGRRGDWVEVPVSTEGEAARLTYTIQVFWGLRRLVCRKITKVGFPPSLPPWSQRKMQYTHGSPSWEQLL